jgi:hypothetical protein
MKVSVRQPELLLPPVPPPPLLPPAPPIAMPPIPPIGGIIIPPMPPLGAPTPEVWLHTRPAIGHEPLPRRQSGTHRFAQGRPAGQQTWPG